jgi:hypothetical protein
VNEDNTSICGLLKNKEYIYLYKNGSMAVCSDEGKEVISFLNSTRIIGGIF